MVLIDTHCHIDLEQFDEDRCAVLQHARDAGVNELILIAFSPERWDAGFQLEAVAPRIHLAVGLHPTEASRFNDGILSSIRELAQDQRVVAIGETGLDFYWDAASKEDQVRSFEAQIELARELDLPFIIHQRDAEEAVLEVLRNMNPPHRGVLHCFTGGWDYAQEILDLGLTIGFGGAVTFKSRTDLHEAAARVPSDRLVIETDAPFMAPVPHRGKRNEPGYVRLVAARLAELRDTTIELISEQSTANAQRLFRLNHQESERV